MTERELEILRFEKVEVPIEESGDKPYYYYTHDVVRTYQLDLMTWPKYWD